MNDSSSSNSDSPTTTEMKVVRKVFESDFFYLCLFPFFRAYHASRLLLLNKACYQAVMSYLMQWNEEGLSFPDAHTYEMLTDWEQAKGIKMPHDLKWFYSAWQERFPLSQQIVIRRPRHPYPLRELKLPCQDQDTSGISNFATPELICLACSEMCSAHKDYDVYLLTLMDLTGQWIGVKNGIFDMEYIPFSVDTSMEEEVIDQLYAIVHEQGLYRGLGYAVRNVELTAHDIFELIEMMKENRFYYTDLPSPTFYKY